MNHFLQGSDLQRDFKSLSKDEIVFFLYLAMASFIKRFEIMYDDLIDVMMILEKTIYEPMQTMQS